MDTAHRIEDILKDCGVLAGNPSERRSAAVKGSKFITDPNDLESIAAYLQATSPLEHLPARVLRAAMVEASFLDYRDVAARWEAQNPPEPEPGGRDREENTQRERTRDSYASEKDAAELYQRLMHGDTLPVKPTAKQLEIGAQLCGHPCPRLAASLLLKGKRAELTLWIIWFHRSGTGPDGAFKSPRSLDRAEKVERFRESMQWLTDGERETVEERRHRLDKRVKVRE
jgi:hypothetical protein